MKVFEIKARKGIDRAIAKGKIFHLWFHPFNFGYEEDRQFEGLERVLEYATLKIKEGVLDIRTMYDLTQ